MARKEKMIEKAQKFIQKGNLEKALTEYRAVAAIDPNDITIGLRIGELCVKTGKKDEAIKEYSDVARANTHKGFYLKAIAVYKQILKLDESILEVHYKLAELYGKQKLVVDAISEFTYLANYYEKSGKPGEVVTLYQMMIDVDPENIGVRLKLAEHYQKQNFDKDALSEYGAIFTKLIKDNKYDKAERIYTDLYNSYPSEPQVVTGLADICKHNGDDLRYLRFTKKLFDIHSGEGNTFDAIAAKEEILQLASDDPDVVAFIDKFKESCGDEAPVEGSAQEPSDEAGDKAEVEIKPEEAEEVQVEEPAPVEKEVEIPVESEEEKEIEVSLDGFDEEEEEPVAEEAAPVEEEVEAPVEEPAIIEEELPEVVEAPVEEEVPEVEEAGEELIEPEAALEEAAGEVIEEEAQVEEPAIIEEEIPEVAETPVEEEAVEEEAPVEEAAPVEEEALAEEGGETAEEAISDAISELMEKMEPGGPLVDTASTDKVNVEEDVVDSRDEYVDLSAELGIEESGDLPSPTQSSTRANETNDEFRTGLEKQLGKEDSETHYNLGIAYMEMELFKEASKEFKLASKDPNLAFDCYTRLGLSATAESNHDGATGYYLKALKVEGRTEDERRGCMYELALAYEATSNAEEAAALFMSINEVDPGYREVAEKVKKLAAAGAEPVAHAMHIPVDDGLIEVELL